MILKKLLNKSAHSFLTRPQRVEVDRAAGQGGDWMNRKGSWGITGSCSIKVEPN
jgi:hypothetical protein